MTTSEHVWRDEADDEWADAFALAAARLPAVRHGDIVVWLDEVHAAVGESEVSAEVLYGDPAGAAQKLAAGIPITRRAAVDTDGMTPRAAVDGALMTMGTFAVGLAIWGLATRGWFLEATALATVLVGLVLPLGTGGWSAAVLLRRTGRLRASGLTAGITTAVAAALTGAVLLTGEADRIVATVPVAVAAAVGVAAVVGGWVLPIPEAVVDDRSRSWAPAEWFNRLDGLLRGRHGLDRSDARAAVEEARSYVQESGSTHPYDEFGAPEVHAARLAGGR